MDPSPGVPSPDDRPSEPIVSITNHFTGHWFLGTLHYYSLIITEKRVICVRTDGLLTARRKETLDRMITLRGRLSGSVMAVLTREWSDTDFSGTFRKMHPSDITIAYPHAVIIPVSGVVSFAVWEELARPIDIGYNINTRWVIEITGKGKKIELISERCPQEILGNYPLRRLFPGRFLLPTKNYTGWMLGNRHD